MTKEKILELRRETFAAYMRGETHTSTGEHVTEQLDVEQVALDPQGGILGMPSYWARRISQADALARCAAVYAKRHAPNGGSE